MTSPARADHAIAMHGAPLYGENFAHFDYVNPDAPKGGAAKFSKGGSFDNLNDVIITGTNAEGLEYITDKLMQRAWNEPFTLYGLVAENVEVAEDRSWIVFHLNKAARFHDGAPMSAADVKFSFDAYRLHGHPVRRRIYGLVETVEIADPHTIKFVFGKGYDRESVLILALMQVLPKHYWEKRDITKTTLEPPLGSGPYKIAKVDPGRGIVYERVKDYWAKDLPLNRGLYNFDTLSYSYYRDDSIALEAFKAGEYNVRREYDVKKWNTGYDFPALKEGKVVKEEVAHQRPEWLKALVFNTRRPAFEDRRVRRALSLLFNYEWVNKNLFYGAFRPIESVFANAELAATGVAEGEELAALLNACALSSPSPPRPQGVVGEGRGEGVVTSDMTLQVPSLPRHPPHPDPLPPAARGERGKCGALLPDEVFGPAWQAPSSDRRANEREAMRLLKEAGWRYKDGGLVDAKGKPFAFEILLGDSNDEKLALEFSRNLQKIGIAARVRTVDSAQFAGRLQDFDYDMVSFRWINSLSPGNEQVNYWGSAAAELKGSRNYAGVSSPAVDALAAGIGAANTREGLVARAHALDRALMWGYYFVPLFYSGKDRLAYAADIIRPDVTPVYGVVLESWWHKAP